MIRFTVVCSTSISVADAPIRGWLCCYPSERLVFGVANRLEALTRGCGVELIVFIWVLVQIFDMSLFGNSGSDCRISVVLC